MTRRDIYGCVPFQNELVRVEVSGPDLRELLEQSLGRRDGPNLLVSGLTVRYDAAQPRGQRIVSAEVGNAPLAKDRMYKLATTDLWFLVSGEVNVGTS